MLAGLLVPLAVAAILLPWRARWSNTNVALVLVVAVVAVAALGSRAAGALAAVSAAAWFDFLLHPALRAVHDRGLSRYHHRGGDRASPRR